MKIVLATGGSAGHLFPAIEVANELKKNYHDITFMGALHIGTEVLNDMGYPYIVLKAKGLQGKGRLGDFLAGVSLIMASAYSVVKLAKIKPEIVVGFGGYGAFPVIMAALILRKPTIIHEQNVVPGRANKLLARFVNKVAISFEPSGKYFNPQKTVLTGCPIKIEPLSLERSDLLNEFGLIGRDPIILVFGGSQGSRRINEMVVDMATQLKKKMDFEIIHICGKGHISRYRATYKQLQIPHAVFEFYRPMQKAYCLADIVISRAGASTISEIAMFRRPAILIPYPYAGGHQMENAKVLSDLKVAKIIKEDDLTIGRLVEDILDIQRQPPDNITYDNVSQHMRLDQASKNLAEEVVSTV